MADNYYVKFLDVLINETKQNKIKWEYLDKYKALIKSMEWCTTSFMSAMTNTDPEPKFNTEDSFCVKLENTENTYYIVIYVCENNPATLYVIPPTLRKIVHLTADEYGDQITRLLNLVQSQFPNADQFIKDFINERIQQA